MQNTGRAPEPRVDQRRRRYPRIPTAATVLVSQVDGRAVDQFARTRTVGLGGCGFLYREELPVGAVVELMIAVRPVAVRTLARVVYLRAVEEAGAFEVGVEFLALEPEDRRRIEDLLHTRLAPETT
jgi:hypothetical protein